MMSMALRACIDKMRAAGVGEAGVCAFARQHACVRAARQTTSSRNNNSSSCSSDSIYIREADVCAIGHDELPTLDSLPPAPSPSLQCALLSRTVVLKFAGGIGTTMGLRHVPKALVRATATRTFLDVAVAQMRRAHARYHALAPHNSSSSDSASACATSPLRFVWMSSPCTAPAYRSYLHAHDTHWPEVHCSSSSNSNTALVDDAVPAYVHLVQHAVVKVAYDTLMPVHWPRDARCEWAPAGHGDVYTVLHTTGLLHALRQRGYRYLFLSNADNLAATLEPRVLAHMHAHALPFVMEVCQRTEHDRVKGGHLAKVRAAHTVDKDDDDGISSDNSSGRADHHHVSGRATCVTSRLVLRETAQCHADDVVHFRDTHMHAYFNTNNLYVDLDALAARLQRQNDSDTSSSGCSGCCPAGTTATTCSDAAAAAAAGVLSLPVLCNVKTVDPLDATSPRVCQLESAAGAAVSLFARATALVVPRSRFVPVKSCADLLAVRSDAYTLSDDDDSDDSSSSTADDDSGALRLSPRRVQQLGLSTAPVIDLDTRYYRHLDGLERLLSRGVPSLVACTRLSVRGPVVLGARTILRGCVHIECVTDDDNVDNARVGREQPWAVLDDNLVLDNTTYTIRAPCA